MPGSSVKQSVLRDEGGGAGEISDQREAADSLDVPEECDLLQTHGRDAGRRTDDQDRAAGAGTVGVKCHRELSGGIYLPPSSVCSLLEAHLGLLPKMVPARTAPGQKRRMFSQLRKIV